MRDSETWSLKCPVGIDSSDCFFESCPGSSPAHGIMYGADQRIGVLEEKRVGVKLGEVEDFPIAQSHVKSLVHGEHKPVSLDLLNSVKGEVKTMNPVVALERSIADDPHVNDQPAHTVLLSGGAVMAHCKTLETRVDRGGVLGCQRCRIGTRGIGCNWSAWRDWRRRISSDFRAVGGCCRYAPNI